MSELPSRRLRISLPVRLAVILGASLALTVLSTAARGASPEEAVVVIRASLQPSELEVEPGTSVTWRNEDSQRHRVRSREGPVEFDSGNLEPGEAFSFTFVVPGRYPYLDERDDEDADYFGTVIVADADPTGGPPPLTAAVTIVDEDFHPPSLELAVGGTVEWTHLDGDDEHTVSSTEGLFDSGVMVGGSTFRQTFETAGSFSYFCAFHADMVGTITVSGPDVDPSAEPAATSSPGATGEVAVSPAPTLSADPTASGAAAEGRSEVSIAGLAFEPADVEVAPGTTVTWTNEDPFEHTATADDGSFDSGILGPGGAFSWTFEAPGSYEYLCALHPSMRGVVVVTDPGGG